MTISDTPGEGLDPKARTPEQIIGRDRLTQLIFEGYEVRRSPSGSDTAGPAGHAGLVGRLNKIADFLTRPLSKNADAQTIREAIAALSRAPGDGAGEGGPTEPDYQRANAVMAEITGDEDAEGGCPRIDWFKARKAIAKALAAPLAPQPIGSGELDDLQAILNEAAEGNEWRMHADLAKRMCRAAATAIGASQQQLSDCKSSLRAVEAERDSWKEAALSDDSTAVDLVKAAQARAEAAEAREKLLRAALVRLIKIADSGHFRDGTHLSIAAHPAFDDARALASKEGGK